MDSGFIKKSLQIVGTLQQSNESMSMLLMVSRVFHSLIDVEVFNRLRSFSFLSLFSRVFLDFPRILVVYRLQVLHAGNWLQPPIKTLCPKLQEEHKTPLPERHTAGCAADIGYSLWPLQTYRSAMGL